MKIFCSIILCFLCVSFFIPITAKNSSKDGFFDILGVCKKDKSDNCVKGLVQDAIIKFAKGVPELNVAPLDPLVVDNLNMDLDDGQNREAKVHFKKGDVRGAKNCKVLLANVRDNVANLDVLCSLVIDGDYDCKGKIMGYNIDGDGHATITINDLKVSVKATFGTEKIKGQTHLKLDDLKTTYKFQGPVKYDATDLIKGSPFMTKAILRAINQNWEMISRKFADPAVQFAVKYITGSIKKVLKKVPANQLKNYIS